jgi:cell wall-associated NlpC family hydrolase
MHHTRLVGGLISLAALLTLLFVPSAIIAASGPSPAPSGTPAPSPTTTTADPAARGAAPRTSRLTRAQRREQRLTRRRHKVVRVARSLRGIPYVYGGASRSGFDCSGLTMYVYRRVGISLSHGATDQSRRGSPVSLRRLKPGDLVFYGGSGFYSHVAIYAGHGKVIDAPHTGAVVSYSRMRGAATARRIIGS